MAESKAVSRPKPPAASAKAPAKPRSRAKEVAHPQASDAPDGGPPDAYDPVEAPVADGRVWIDLLNPSEADIAHAAGVCGLRIPSREELSEIESSSRHYVEKGALYLSAALVAGAASEDPHYAPTGFIVTRERLVTVRFDEMKAFDMATERVKTEPPKSGLEAFLIVVEAVVDRVADLFEELGAEAEELSGHVFKRAPNKKRDSQAMTRLLVKIGSFGDRNSKLRGSLVTLGRILPFVVDTADGMLPPEIERRLLAAKEDVHSLTGYQENLANKLQFLLDAALGFINIDQNDVFKILTVVSAVGVPPTLVASIYGMNFKAMPELNWAYGYPYAIALMIVSTVVPLIWFRMKGWF